MMGSGNWVRWRVRGGINGYRRMRNMKVSIKGGRGMDLGFIGLGMGVSIRGIGRRGCRKGKGLLRKGMMR